MTLQFDDQSRPISLRLPTIIFRYAKADEALMTALERSHLWFAANDAVGDPVGGRTVLSTECSEVELFEYLRSIQGDQVNQTIIAEQSKLLHRDRQKRDALFEKIIQTRTGPPGICCFADRSRIDRLWEKCADEHHGVCLAYAAPLMVIEGGLGIIRVNYRSRRMKYNEIKERLRFNESALYHSRFDRAMFGTKLKNVAWEREVRLISSKQGENLVHRDWLAGIVYGANIERETRVKIGKLVSEHYPHAYEIDQRLVGQGYGYFPDLSDWENNESDIQVGAWRKLDSTN